MQSVNKHKHTMHFLFGKQRPGTGENAEKMRENAGKCKSLLFPPLDGSVYVDVVFSCIRPLLDDCTFEHLQPFWAFLDGCIF